MTADSSTVTVSGDDGVVAGGGGGGGGGGGVNSPSSRRTLTSPWAQVVRGVIEVEPVAVSPAREVAREVSDPVVVVDAPPEKVDSQPERCNADVMRPVWNKPPVNGVVEASVAPVMGADLWPALSESTKPGAKSVAYYSESSSKSSSDLSVAVSQGPVISQPPTKQTKPNANNAHSRQKPVRRGGGNAGGISASYNRPPPPPPLPPPFPLFDMYGNLVPQPPPVLESPQSPFKGNNWSPRSADPSLNRNPARRNNFGPRPVNNGGRRDHHDRDWRGPRSHQMGPPPPPPPPPLRGFIRGPAPFIPHQPLRPFGAPMGYDMGASYVYVPTLPQEPFRGVAPPFPLGPPASIFVHQSLRDVILQQIEYYFCDANLVKDNYLKSQMDEEGWVPISLIAGFRRVQMLTYDIQMIMSSLIDSSIIEVQGDKVRRRNDWRKWLLTSSQSPGESTNKDNEDASLQKLTLEDIPTKGKEVSDSPKLVNGEVGSEDLCS